MFGALSVASSGLAADNQWLAMAAGNIANANDTATTAAGAYRTQAPVLSPVPAGAAQGQAVAVTQVAAGPPGQPVSAPSSPVANAQGVVFYPTDSMAGQLTQADTAGLAAQANVAVLRQAIAAYQALLGPPTGQGTSQQA